MAHFKKGMEVHVRDYRGQADTDNRYKIRSCGKRQATLDFMREESSGLNYRSRGQNFYITPREEAIANYGRELPSHVKTNWSQHFVLAGIDGWDPCEN